MLSYTVREDQRSISTDEFVGSHVDVPRFLALCRKCPAWGRTWACPEFDFDPMEVWASRRWFHVLARTLSFTPDQPRRGFAGDSLRSQVMDLFTTEKRRLRHRIVVLRARHRDSVPLLAGSCDLCEHCARLDGQACIHPGQLIHSIESLGGDVGGLLHEYFGIDMEWSDGTSLPDSYHLVAGILSDAPQL